MSMLARLLTFFRHTVSRCCNVTMKSLSVLNHGAKTAEQVWKMLCLEELIRVSLQSLHERDAKMMESHD